jgi:hypothetical protein
MSIRQVNCTYVPEEDRVMFRFSTGKDELQEYRLWLTRAVLSQLLRHTQVLAVEAVKGNMNVQQAQEVAEFKQEALAQNVKYTQFESAPKLPLGAEPTLVKAVTAKTETVNDSQKVAALVFQLARGQNLTLRMNDDLLGKLQLLFKKMNDTAGWALVVNQAVKVLH